MPCIAFQVSSVHAMDIKTALLQHMKYKNASVAAVANIIHNHLCWNFSHRQCLLQFLQDKSSTSSEDAEGNNWKLLFSFFMICSPETYLWHSVKMIC